jgi:hypothetical protein
MVIYDAINRNPNTSVADPDDICPNSDQDPALNKSSTKFFLQEILTIKKSSPNIFL